MTEKTPKSIDEFNREQLNAVKKTGSRVKPPHPPAKKERDEITVAKSIFDEIVEFSEETPKQKRARKAGRARAVKMTSEERSAAAKLAANARWKKKN